MLQCSDTCALNASLPRWSVLQGNARNLAVDIRKRIVVFHFHRFWMLIIAGCKHSFVTVVCKLPSVPCSLIMNFSPLRPPLYAGHINMTHFYDGFSSTRSLQYATLNCMCTPYITMWINRTSAHISRSMHQCYIIIITIIIMAWMSLNILFEKFLLLQLRL